MESQLNAQQMSGECRGICYSSESGKLISPASWRAWFWGKSKKIWFRVPPNAKYLEFRYQGRIIIHSCRPWEYLGWPWAQKIVLWGDNPYADWESGPMETTLYLCLWTRWSWLNSDCRWQPERFSVAWSNWPAMRQSHGINTIR